MMSQAGPVEQERRTDEERGERGGGGEENGRRRRPAAGFSVAKTVTNYSKPPKPKRAVHYAAAVRPRPVCQSI